MKVTASRVEAASQSETPPSILPTKTSSSIRHDSAENYQPQNGTLTLVYGSHYVLDNY